MRIHVTIDVPDEVEQGSFTTTAAQLMEYATEAEDRNPHDSPVTEIGLCLAARLDEFYVGGACVVIGSDNVTVRVEP